MALFSRNSKIEALKRAPLFEGLSRKELTEVAKATEEMEFEAGSVLCQEGRLGHEFFVVLEGEVEVTRGGKRLRSRNGDAFFGEIAIIENVPRTATVTAKTAVRAFVLTSQAFRAILDRNEAIERKVLRALARRVVNLCEDDATVA